MQEKTGMGESGESYIVGSVNGKTGYYMLSQSRLTNEDTIFKREITSKDVLRVMKEKQEQRGTEFCQNNIYIDYHGTKVLGHNHYLKIGKHEWGVVTEIDESEIFKEANNLMFIITVIIVIVVAFIIIVSILFSLSISKPLMKVSDILKNSSGQIASASTQLSSSSQEIASGATEQASSIEETSSSMEELASMVKQNVSNAQEASILSQKASEASQNGHNQMENMLESMVEINRASEEIQKIIKVIDDIAFQTNILALNAAVEAARAGEAGMGFAVVADEVKNLANKSAEAAKETSSIIEDSIKKTGAGLDTATKLGEVFKDILNNSQKVAEMVKEVETASKQQDTGINQVNKAIIQFDEVVQANASSAEETASSAEELLTQVETLSDIVSQLVLIVSGKIVSMEDHSQVKHIEHKDTKTKNVDIKKRQDIKAKIKEIPPEKIIPFEEDEDFTIIE
jgi:methyl-accepting chemotaxis protein